MHPPIPPAKKQIDKEEAEKASRRIVKTRTGLIFDKPVLAPLLFKLEPKAIPFGTMATNGKALLYNPTFVNNLEVKYLKFAMLHEVFHCFPAGTHIAGDDKPIEAFRAGDYVLGRGGKKCRIVKTSSRGYSGELITVKAVGLLPLEMTSEHPVLVTSPTWITSHKNKTRTNVRKWSPPTWKKATELCEGDWVFVPKISGSDTTKILEFEYSNAWSVKKKVRNGIKLDEELAELIGWYVAEGSSTEATDHWVTQFSLGKDEVSVAEWIKEVVFRRTGYSTRIIQSSNGEGICAVLNSAPLGRFLSVQCGTGAHNKRIPECILYHKNEKILKAFLRGYVGGDGFSTKVVSFGTSSKTLALQIQLAFARFGVLVNLYVRPPKDSVIRGKVVHGGTLYVGISANSKVFDVMKKKRNVGRPTQYFGEFDGHLVSRVTSVSRKNWSGVVYNFETEDHTYTAGNIVTHNCCFRHPSRRGTRNPEIWNIAADLVINGILVYDEKIESPSWICVDKEYHKTEWEKKHPDHPLTAETVYEELIKNAEVVKVKFKITCPCIQKDPTEGGSDDSEGGKDKKDGHGSCSHGHDAGEDGKPDKGWDVNWDKGLEEEWKQAVIQAEQMARMRGDSPGWMSSLVEEIIEPKVPLDKILLQYIGTVISDETSWKSPNRRFVSRGIYLPSAVADKKDGVIVIDTSGSISDEEALDFLGITAKVLRSKGINEVRLIQCDMTITDDARFRRPGDFKSHAKKTGIRGRGGTSFRPPFEKLEKEKSWNIAFLMYLTDLCGDFPDKAPKFPVIWVSTTENAAPFGTTIYWDRKSDKIKVMKGKGHAEKV